jgi:hypothetical protein
MMSINLNCINNLYTHGVSSFFLKEQRIKVLEKMIKQEHWINNKHLSKNDEILCAPDWMHQANKTAMSKTDALKNPYEKERISKQTIKGFMPVKYYDYFTSVFNTHQYNCGLGALHYSAIEVVSVALWNGVGDFNWHWDGPGNDDLYALVYLSDYQEWPQEFGAGLEYGTAQMSESKQGYQNIEQKGVFYPDNGRIVIGENRNPLWVHRTQHYSEQALKDKINRFTFLVTMKLKSLLPDIK